MFLMSNLLSSFLVVLDGVISKDEAIRTRLILREIAYIKNSKIFLKKSFMKEINHDWPFFSEVDRLELNLRQSPVATKLQQK